MMEISEIAEEAAERLNNINKGYSNSACALIVQQSIDKATAERDEEIINTLSTVNGFLRLARYKGTRLKPNVLFLAQITP